MTKRAWLPLSRGAITLFAIKLSYVNLLCLVGLNFARGEGKGVFYRKGYSRSTFGKVERFVGFTCF